MTQHPCKQSYRNCSRKRRIFLWTMGHNHISREHLLNREAASRTDDPPVKTTLSERFSPALDNSLLDPPTCRGLPPAPARHRCGGAPSSIPRLHADRCSSPANRRAPAPLRSSLGHVRCPRCMRHRHLWEPLPPHPPPVDDPRLAPQRSLVRPAPSWLSLLPIRAIDHQTGAWRTRLSRVTRPPSSARDHH